MAEFMSTLALMMAHPPDPNAPPPLANRKGTMFGVTIPFHVGQATGSNRLALIISRS